MIITEVMNLDVKNLLDELKPLAGQKELIIEKIKAHNLPIILYGAGEYAKYVTDALKKFDVEIAGYAVDDAYFKAGANYLGLPVYRISELTARPEDFVFILATDNVFGGGGIIEKFLADERLIKYGLDVATTAPMNYDYISANAEKILDTYSMVADDLSKETLLAYLKLKLTSDMHWNRKVFSKGLYFNELTNGVRTPKWGEVFVDCGAYRGETVSQFIKWCGGNYKKIYSLEPDAENFKILNDYIKAQNYKNVETFNLGAWSQKDTLHFNADGTRGAHLIDGGIFEIETSNGAVKMAVDSLDNLIEDKHADLVKMDVEGSEMQALRGAAEIIKTSTPALAICLYHKAEDIFTIPQYVKQLNPNYKIYLRKHGLVSAFELVLYAIDGG